jgi:hypothetical protein
VWLFVGFSWNSLYDFFNQEWVLCTLVNESSNLLKGVNRIFAISCALLSIRIKFGVKDSQTLPFRKYKFRKKNRWSRMHAFLMAQRKVCMCFPKVKDNFSERLVKDISTVIYWVFVSSVKIGAVSRLLLRSIKEFLFIISIFIIGFSMLCKTSKHNILVHLWVLKKSTLKGPHFSYWLKLNYN